MPPKKVTVPAFKQMEARVEALESEISVVRTSIIDVQNTVKENHASLIALIEKWEAKGGCSNTTHNVIVSEFRHAVKKVELPMFTGEDPAGWISRSEIYFHVHETISEVKVKLAHLCMEGSTIHFFNSLLRENEDLTWEGLKEALLGRYGGHGEGDVYEQLTELKQDGTVDEYITEFEYLTAQIPKLPDKQFLGYFLHGLKTEVRGKVRSMAAMGEMSRTKLFQVTRAVEKEIKGSGSSFYRRSKTGNGSLRPSFHGSGKNNSDWVMVRSREKEYNGGARSNNIGPKQKGLCFKCGGAFHPMHQCPDKHLKILVVEDEEDEESEARVLAVEVEDSDEEKTGEICELTLNHIAYENHKTVKFQGQICGVPVLILVDSGATHNFVSQKLVQKMGWTVEETPLMSIKLGDGSRDQSQGVVKGLEMAIGEFKLTLEMHLFELGGIDVVLGMDWLKTLGDMIVNWRQQTMSFWSNKKWVTLQGIDGGDRELVALQCILSKPRWGMQNELWGIETKGVEEESVLTPTQQKQ
ncbi:hypothetical protein TSUD_375770, partial [Trifolium subterraneum]